MIGVRSILIVVVRVIILVIIIVIMVLIIVAIIVIIITIVIIIASGPTLSRPARGSGAGRVTGCFFSKRDEHPSRDPRSGQPYLLLI